MTVYPNKDELLESTTSTDLEPLEETECCCHHRIVEDYIDVDPDRSVKIFYCDTCYITVNEDGTDYTDEPPIILGEPVEFIPLVDN